MRYSTCAIRVYTYRHSMIIEGTYSIVQVASDLWLSPIYTGFVYSHWWSSSIAAFPLIAIVLPFYAPLALFLKGGFTIIRSPPVICFGRDVDTNFYSVIAPTTVILAIGTTMLLLLFWRIRQVATIAYLFSVQ